MNRGECKAFISDEKGSIIYQLPEDRDIEIEEARTFMEELSLLCDISLPRRRYKW